ncbi:PIN domain-containing protein [Candidatus Woesearchaeota archaeon]|nr:PIN domain-containing protein [Candidatus Woesearchaeota archaeon]
MTSYIVDAYAWIEYFRGSKKGEPFKKLLMSEAIAFISVECTIAEVRLWAIRNTIDFDKLFVVMKANSSFSPVTLHDWIEAAAIRQEMRKTRERFGLIDALLLVKQKEQRCHIITGDPHFKGLPSITYLV